MTGFEIMEVSGHMVLGYAQDHQDTDSALVQGVCINLVAYHFFVVVIYSLAVIEALYGHVSL